MRHVQGQQPCIDGCQHSQNHMRIHMPHMPHPEKSMPRRIARLCHSKADAQSHLCLALQPSAQFCTMRRTDPKRCDRMASMRFMRNI